MIHWWGYAILVIVLAAIAIGFALDWRYDKTHFTGRDDEKLEAPKERNPK
jgi:hypothetical protein